MLVHTKQLSIPRSLTHILSLPRSFFHFALNRCAYPSNNSSITTIKYTSYIYRIRRCHSLFHADKILYTRIERQRYIEIHTFHWICILYRMYTTHILSISYAWLLRALRSTIYLLLVLNQNHFLFKRDEESGRSAVYTLRVFESLSLCLWLCGWMKSVCIYVENRKIALGAKLRELKLRKWKRWKWNDGASFIPNT